MEKLYDKIYHISDNDFDGYGSQFILSQTKEDISFFNPSIADLSKTINEVFTNILENYKSKKILILITDITINETIAKKLNNFKKGNKNIDINIKVLDHHKTGIEVANNNDWYTCEVSKCSAKLTAIYTIDTFEVAFPEFITFIGNFIDASDRWLKEDKFFYQSNYINDKIKSETSDFPEELNEIKRDYIFYIINTHINLFYIGKTTKEVESISNSILETYFKDKIDKEIYTNDNISVFIKKCYYLASCFTELEKNIIRIEDKKILVFFKLSPSLNQYIPSIILENSEYIDATLNVNNITGKVSLRARKETVDVEQIANKYFSIIESNKIGGGHKGASGGFLDFKNIKINNIEDLLAFLNKKFS